LDRVRPFFNEIFAVIKFILAAYFLDDCNISDLGKIITGRIPVKNNYSITGSITDPAFFTELPFLTSGFLKMSVFVMFLVKNKLVVVQDS
jgi:hypothetical protein